MIKNKKFKIIFFVICLIFVFCDFLFAESEKEIITAKFQESKNELLPLTPEQIESFKNTFKETESAIRDMPPPTIVSKTTRVSLTPGSSIPVINMVPGYVSSLAFYDITGAAWPVTSQTIGNDTYFAVSRPEVLPGNLLTVSPKTNYASTNLVVTIEGHDLPVSLQLKTVDAKQDRVTDGLIAFQIDQRGPNAVAPVIGDTTKSSISETMMSFVDNVPPAEAQRLNADPDYSGFSVWLFQDRLYVRTTYTLLWPAWDQTASGAGGNFKVYSLPNVPSIMISVDGKTQSLYLKKGDLHG